MAEPRCRVSALRGGAAAPDIAAPRRLGWSFRGPCKVKLATGEDISLLETSPKMVQQLALQAHHVSLERRAATNLGLGTPTTDRIVMRPIMRVSISRKCLGKQECQVGAAARRVADGRCRPVVAPQRSRGVAAPKGAQVAQPASAVTLTKRQKRASAGKQQ